MQPRIAVFILAVMGLSSTALAGSECASLVDRDFFSCACAVPMSEFTPAGTAALSQINGQVNITTGHQFSSAGPTVPLDIGDGAIVLENSSAVLTFGPSCSRQLREQSSLVIRDVDGCACASVVEAQRTAQSQNLAAPGDRRSNGGKAIATLLLLGGGAGGVTALVLSQSNSDEPVTPE